VNNFFDVERIEVLRGPQGTLYGRNTAGGAINIISKKPHGEFEGEVNLEVGNEGYLVAQGMLNIPLGEKFAWRLSASQRHCAQTGRTGGKWICAYWVTGVTGVQVQGIS
jgi:iron complex outermembrane receptor protein